LAPVETVLIRPAPLGRFASSRTLRLVDAAEVAEVVACIETAPRDRRPWRFERGCMDLLLLDGGRTRHRISLDTDGSFLLNNVVYHDATGLLTMLALQTVGANIADTRPTRVAR
jgi:hypothetical protein